MRRISPSSRAVGTFTRLLVPHGTSHRLSTQTRPALQRAGERDPFIRGTLSRRSTVPACHSTFSSCNPRFQRTFSTTSSSHQQASSPQTTEEVLVRSPLSRRLPPPKAEGSTLFAFSETAQKYVPIPNIFLRDNCFCSSCVHGETRQRLLDTWKIPQDIAIKSCRPESDGFSVDWSDGHKSHYTKEWLARTAIKNDGTVRHGYPDEGMKLWDASIKKNPPVVPYKDVMETEEGLFAWLKNIREYGFSFVEQCPADPDKTEELLKRIAFPRETHYGGFYDFTADLASKDTAYTTIALDAHTDNTYFSDPSGLQMFHLLSHTQGKGGESLLVDGFKAAAQLKKEDPAAYEILSTVNIYAHASGNDGISIQPYRSFPVLLHDEHGRLIQVRWNSSDRAAIDLPIEEVEGWYDAARKWAAILSSAENEYWEQLKPGTPLIFDNWRVLHGRAAFNGKRRICGGYVNRDDYISRFKMVCFGSENVLPYLATA